MPLMAAFTDSVGSTIWLLISSPLVSPLQQDQDRDQDQDQDPATKAAVNLVEAGHWASLQTLVSAVPLNDDCTALLNARISVAPGETYRVYSSSLSQA